MDGRKVLMAALTVFVPQCSYAINETADDARATEIIRKADEIRSPDRPFRYTVTVKEFRAGESEAKRVQKLDISMRFIKPHKGQDADARSLVRFVYPPADKGKVMLSNWYELWFYTPELRRPIPIDRQQRLLGQISNGDVIVTNFDYAYRSSLIGEEACGDRQCYKLRLKRKIPQTTWPEIIYLVEKESYRPFKASYLSLDGRAVKEVLYQHYQPLLDNNRPTRIVVTDLNHKNSYSVMEYSDVRYESLPLSRFTREYIQRGGK